MPRLAIVIVLASTIACSLTTPTPAPAPPLGVTGWSGIANGIDYRPVVVKTGTGFDFEMQIVRLDPALVRFRVHYRPGTPYTFADWQEVLHTDELVFINANFFTDEYEAIGLVIADGQPYGFSLSGYGGMFQVDDNGEARIRALRQEPYAGEKLYQATQSFPMLVEPGGLAAPTGSGFNDPARRSVIAQDRSGHILLMSTGTFGQISFYDLQTWLLNSDLDIDAAFALDGGRSTAMYVSRPGFSPITITPFSPLPTVLAVTKQ